MVPHLLFRHWKKRAFINGVRDDERFFIRDGFLSLENGHFDRQIHSLFRCRGMIMHDSPSHREPLENQREQPMGLFTVRHGELPLAGYYG